MPVTIVGNNTPTAGGVVYGDGTSYASTAAGTNGQVLTSAGSGSPTWTTLSVPNTIGQNMAFTDVSLTLSSAITSSTTVIPKLQAVALTATTELLLLQGDSSMHAVVYDSSANTYGTPVLVRTANIGNVFDAGLVAISSTAVLVCSLPNTTTSLQTVVLSISGSTITVNTALTTTLAASSALIINATRLIAVGTSYVLSYQTTSNNLPKFRAITVSGTTPSIGAELAYAGGNNIYSQRAFAYDSGTLLHMSASTTVFYAYPITVSGTTLTGGTQATTTVTSQVFVAGALSTGRYALAYLNTSGKIALVSVSTGTATITAAANSLGVSSWFPNMQVFSDKAFVLTGSGASDTLALVTDSSGTPVVGGSTFTGGSQYMINYLGTDKVVLASSTANSSLYSVYVISSGSPALYKSFISVTNSSLINTFNGGFNYSYKNAGLPIAYSDGYCLLRTSAGRVAVPYSNYPYSVSVDGNYFAVTENCPNTFAVWNDALSTAVCWGVPPSPDAYRLTLVMRKITLT